MRILSSTYVALLALLSLVMVGCSTATIVKLSGTPGAQVSGHYLADHVSSDFSGAAAWEMDLGHQKLQGFEFRKATLGDLVDLEIRKGHKVVVHAIATPGVVGLRAHNDGGWRLEKLLTPANQSASR